ncbi:hypothetical protein NMG60_11019791 [Bertholletia excelsa]
MKGRRAWRNTAAVSSLTSCGIVNMTQNFPSALQYEENVEVRLPSEEYTAPRHPNYPDKMLCSSSILPSMSTRLPGDG